MQTNAEIHRKIKTHLEDTCLVSFGAEIDEETNLIQAGFIDSFGIVQLIAFVEATYDIRLTDAEITSSELSSLGGIVRLVSSKLSA